MKIAAFQASWSGRVRLCLTGLGASLLATCTGCTHAPGAAEARYGQTEKKPANAVATSTSVEEAYAHAVGAKAESTGIAPEDCELRLYIEQAPSGGAFGMDAGHLGAAAVERAPEGVVDGVCIKHTGKDLELPAAILLASASDGPTLARFCRDDPKPSKSVSGAKSVDVSICTWDGTFHSARPFTFTFVSANDTSVGDLVEFIRIYRNGDLMAAWNRASDQNTGGTVVLGGRALRSGFLSASLPPHRAALDLRIIPRGASPGDVELKVRNDKKRFEERIVAGLSSGVNAALPEGAKEALNCLRQKAANAQLQIRAVVHGDLVVPQLAVGCTMALPGQTALPLSDAYAAAKNQTELAIAEVRSDAIERLEQLRDSLEKGLSEAEKEALEKGFRAVVDGASTEAKARADRYLNAPTHPGVREVIQLLEKEQRALGATDPVVKSLGELLSASKGLVEDVDRQVRETLRTVDETRALASTLYQSARGIVKSPERQAEIFNAVAVSLHQQGDVFEARRDNPAPLAGEQLMPMEYADYFQGFILAPWNGVPFHSGKAELSGTVAIPLLDLAGVRLQWDKSRLADLRGAVGIGYIEAKLTSSDGATEEALRFLPHASIGLATFKLGVGIVVGDGFDKVSDRWRLLVGADLYKLVSGNNVEVF